MAGVRTLGPLGRGLKGGWGGEPWREEERKEKALG